MLPYIAVIMIILILFTAFQYGLAAAYLMRTKVRDALDSAVLSAASIAEVQEKPTYYGEKKKKNSDGTYTWVKTTSGEIKYITLSKTEAEDIAYEYLLKNLSYSGLKNWSVLSLDIDVTSDKNILQINKNRPHTENTITSWESNFPQWVQVSAAARVSVPVPTGSILGMDRMVLRLYSQSKKQVDVVNVGSGGWD